MKAWVAKHQRLGLLLLLMTFLGAIRLLGPVPTHEFCKANFRKVTLGMSRQEVEALLGPARNVSQNLCFIELVEEEGSKEAWREGGGFSHWMSDDAEINLIWDARGNVNRKELWLPEGRGWFLKFLELLDLA